MIDREEQFEQLSAYLDGELDAAEALELEAAIHADEVLQAEYESLRQTRQLLRQLPVETAPDHFAHAVMARAEKHHHLGKANPAGMYRSWRWIQLATAAVVLISAGLGLIVISQMSPPQDAEPYVAAGPESDALAGRERRILAAEAEAAFDEDIARVEAAAPPAAPGLPDVVTEVIWTDDLALARRDVEEVLADNAIKPAEWGEAMMLRDSEVMAANVYQTTRTDDQQIRLVVNVEPNQVAQLRSDLTRLRTRQTVSQMPMDAGFDYRSKAADGADSAFAQAPAATVAADEELDETVLRDAAADELAAKQREELEAEASTASADVDEDGEDMAGAFPGVMDKDEEIGVRGTAATEHKAAPAETAPVPEGVPDFLQPEEMAAAPEEEDSVDEADEAGAPSLADRLDESPTVGRRSADSPQPRMQQVVIYLNRAASTDMEMMRRASPTITDDETESRN